MEIPNIDIAICTPGSSMVSSHVVSLLKTTSYLTSRNIPWTYMNAYSSHVADARERTVGGPEFNSASLKQPGGGRFTYKKLFWIDSDISWEVEDFIRLYESDKQIISGAYKIDNHNIAAYSGPMSPPISIDEMSTRKQPFKVRAVGFGFLAVSSGVFERIERPWFGSISVEFRDELTGEVGYKQPLIGEDTAWCEKVHRLGIDIWLDPLVRVSHQKATILQW